VASPCAEVWNTVSTLAPPREYQSAEELFSQGSLLDHVFLVNYGLIKLIHLDEEGQESILGLRSGGSILGACSAIVKRPSPISAVALVNCQVNTFPVNTFLDLARTDPNLSWYLHQVQSNEVYEQVEHLAGLRNLSAQQRLEQLLWQLISVTHMADERKPVRLNLPLKYWEIAQLVGITPEHLSRVLRQIQEEGKMRRENGALIVFDFQRLYHSKAI
jgi:CRP/FNR family transcriptional regulator